MDPRRRLEALLVERSLQLGDFTLSSGVRSDYYVDARRTTMSAEGQFLLGPVCLERIEAEDLRPSHVGGLTLGADPIAYAIARESWSRDRAVDAFTVRKRTKEHGTGNRVEGGLSEGARVVVVEDTLTTGRSSLEAVRVVEEAGAEVLAVLALVDREEGGRGRVEGAGHRLLSIFTAAELKAAATEG